MTGPTTWGIGGEVADLPTRSAATGMRPSAIIPMTSSGMSSKLVI